MAPECTLCLMVPAARLWERQDSHNSWRHGVDGIPTSIRIDVSNDIQMALNLG